MSQDPIDTYQHPLMSAVQDAAERAQQVPDQCRYKLQDGSPCRCREEVDDALGGHYDCVGPPGTAALPVIPKGFPDYDVLHTTMDAQVWAQQFKATAERLRALGQDVLDDGWLIAWFANAIMRGYDTALEHAARRRWLADDEQHTPLTLPAVKALVIQASLARNKGNVSRTAQELAIDRRTLYRHLRAGKSTP